MIKIFRNIYRFMRFGLSYSFYSIIHIIRTKAVYTNKGRTYAILNFDKMLKDDDLGRYFYLTYTYFRKAGFDLVIKTTRFDFRKPKEYKKLVLEEANVLVRKTSTPLNSVVLVQPNKLDHKIDFCYGYNINFRQDQFDFVAPYPMHPNQYKFYSSSKFDFQNSPRTVKVFFGGRMEPEMYPPKKLEKFFNAIPRVEVINFVLSNFKNSIRLQKESSPALLNKLFSSLDYSNGIIISEVKTSQKDWLNAVSKVHFFICPPGVRMPWSHNCIEAMSVGAIPILQYDYLFKPKLENMKNCLSFANAEELKIAIETALSMEQSQIDVMRKNVLAYYNRYLSLEGIIKRIKSFSDSSKVELKVAIPFIPNLEEWEAIKPLWRLSGTNGNAKF